MKAWYSAIYCMGENREVCSNLSLTDSRCFITIVESYVQSDYVVTFVSIKS